MDLIIFLILIALGFSVGSFVEKRHYSSIIKREKEYLNLPVVSGQNFLEETDKVEMVELVCGSAVISIDYFKLFLAGLRNILGGEVRSSETLVDRARREAILRLKEKAKGASLILNLRLETSQISINSVEVLAYATAVYLKDKDEVYA